MSQDPPSETLASNQSPGRSRRATLVWWLAVGLVLAAWVGLFVLRGSSEPAPGWIDGPQQLTTTLTSDTSLIDRPQILFFTTATCGPCQSFKRDVLSDPSVQAALADRFVPVQMDLTRAASDSPVAQAAERYSVRGVPTLIATDARGNVLSAFNQQRTPERFIAWLDAIDDAD